MLIDLLDDDTRVEEMSRAARERFERTFDSSVVGPVMERFLLGDDGRGPATPHERRTWTLEDGDHRSADVVPQGGDSSRPRRPVAILICYSCGPGAGSESGAGWAWAKAASEVADVVLITHTTWFQSRIVEAIADLGLPITVSFVDLPPWLRALFSAPETGPVRYSVWQALAGREIRRCERRGPIDIVHHVTWASDSLPSALLASRAPVRVWGPVGGTSSTARGLYRYLPLRDKASEIVRRLGNGALRSTSGAAVARHATLVAALNHDVAARWRSGPTPVVIESNTALDPGELAPTQTSGFVSGDGGRRTALFVGRLKAFKGLVVAVESLRHAPGWRLVVLGEGPDRARASALAERIGVADRLEFRGQVPRAEVFDAFRCADALVFPSFHDSAPWSVAEASSLGCPVVCLDAGGGAQLQAGRNAHVVPIAPAATLPERIGACLEGLSGRGEPDHLWYKDRLPGVLRTWYEGSSSGPRPPGARSAPPRAQAESLGGSRSGSGRG